MGAGLKPCALSEYGRLSHRPSPVSRMMSAFAGDFRERRDINLGVGYVNEATIPRGRIQEALTHVLAHPEKYKTPLNYGGPAGSQSLIDSIRRYYTSRRVGGLTADILDKQSVIIGSNGASSLLEGIAEVLEPGIVVTSDPMYYIYCHFLERKGFEIVAVPEGAHGLQADAVARRLEQLGDRRNAISFFYAVTVNNPSASILANTERRKLVRLVTELSSRLKRRVPLILDKAYEDLVHDPGVEPPQSGLLHDEAGIVYEVGTLSKILAPSLRIGYMIGRDGPLLRCLVQKNSDSGFSAPLICQEIASYLLDNYLDEQLATVRRGYREKALAVKSWIDEYLGAGLTECKGGQAGFYFYLTFEDVETHEQSRFFRFLTRTTGDEAADGPAASRHPRVIYIPGEFCVHPRGDRTREGKRQLRISYGFEETPQIGRALAFMKGAIDYAHAGRNP